MSLNVGKILGIGQAQATTNPYRIDRAPENFVKNSFEFGQANPNRPESRDDVHGKHLYCLA